ncbi:hypothetical protein BOX15_Mlig027399g1 [Macrostomum lignano]|uniref:Uncharacterized protein n=2 Tax=Macrostomum lignano TaxID=282301 RepID=A0A267E0G8_9PLAT|nr:hypothetical protein BOX15_Mlig027399g1 [Macrostomum lignano]
MVKRWPLAVAFQSLLDLLLSLVWPMFKWLLTKFSGRCELLRIVLRYPSGAERICKLELAIRASGCPAVRALLPAVQPAQQGGDRGKDELISAAQAAEAASAVAVAKRVEPGVYPQFESALAEAAIAVASHDRLCRRADAVRRVAFSNDCAEHEAKLAKLWTALCPGQPLSGRICKQWGDIGFQGDDPQTDFRGMGMLGLEQLLFLASRYPSQAAAVLSQSQHPVSGFPFAVAGINIGHLVWRLLAARKFRKHFYNLGSYELDDLHRLFCCLFLRFADFWQRQGASVMEFNSVKAKFKRLIKTEAARSDCLFRAPEESSETG